MDKLIYHWLGKVGACVLGILVVFSAVVLYLGLEVWLRSAWLGAFFSALVFLALMVSQHRVLTQRKHGLTVVYLLGRMVLIAVPVGIGLLYEAYFNLFVILIFLFSFQLIFIISSLISSLVKIKKQQG